MKINKEALEYAENVLNFITQEGLIKGVMTDGKTLWDKQATEKLAKWLQQDAETAIENAAEKCADKLVEDTAEMLRNLLDSLESLKKQ